jgi:high-affinity iron transporter
MKRTARGLRNELEGKASKAILAGPVALALAAFAAVAREGLETALFLYTNFKTVGAFSAPTVGLVIGLVAAIALGFGVYNRSIKLNLGKFFTYSGVALIVVAAGVLSHGVGEFLELGWIPGESVHIWDFSSHISEDSFLVALSSGTIGFGPTLSWVQFIVWAGYLWAVLGTYLKPVRTPVAA